MLSRDQIILCKRAQKEAALDDTEYRDAVALVSGMTDCRSSKDERLTDEHLDHLISYFEAIYWLKVDAGQLQQSFRDDAVFRQRGFWASKNQRGNTSRDRYAESSIQHEIADLEAALSEYGCGLSYFQAIQNNMKRGGQPFSLVKYAGALKRTLDAKRRKANCPF